MDLGAIKSYWPWTIVPWTNHHCSGKLVMPALLLGIKCDPDDPEEQKKDGYEVSQIPSECLSERQASTCRSIYNASGYRHFPGRCLFVHPEKHYTENRKNPRNKKVSGSGNDGLVYVNRKIRP